MPNFWHIIIIWILSSLWKKLFQFCWILGYFHKEIINRNTFQILLFKFLLVNLQISSWRCSNWTRLHNLRPHFILAIKKRIFLQNRILFFKFFLRICYDLTLSPQWILLAIFCFFMIGKILQNFGQFVIRFYFYY